MLKLTVTTVERTALEMEDVQEIVVPTKEGVITILPNHVPLVSVLSMGEMIIRSKGKESVAMFVDGGIVEVDKQPDITHVDILTNLAEHAEELDAAKIEEARRRAEKLLEERPVDVDLAKVEASLQRELSRLKLIKKYKPQ